MVLYNLPIMLSNLPIMLKYMYMYVTENIDSMFCSYTVSLVRLEYNLLRFLLLGKGPHIPASVIKGVIHCICMLILSPACCTLLLHDICHSSLHSLHITVYLIPYLMQVLPRTARLYETGKLLKRMYSMFYLYTVMFGL